jgi:DNA replication protein
MRPDAHEDRQVPISEEFFSDILPHVRDLGELKVALHVAHLGAVRGNPAVSVTALFAPHLLRSIVGMESPEPAVDRLRKSVDRAIANGVLLRLTVKGSGATEVYLLPSTQRNRDLVARLGIDPEAADTLRLPAEFEASLYRPNVFAFYERHIGPLTPLIAEQLRDAERSYGPSWIESAILEAVQYNRRNWRYVESILSQWEERGTLHRVSHRDP